MINRLLKDELIEFLGSRFLTNNLTAYFKSIEKNIEGTFFRGMPFPKHLLEIGAVIEEWHGSSHWSIDEKIAQNFAIISKNGYISEDYYDELQEELQCEEVVFIQLIMKIRNLNGVEVYKVLEEINEEKFINEKEVLTLGKDFKIKNIDKKVIDGEEVYYADVDMIF